MKLKILIGLIVFTVFAGIVYWLKNQPKVAGVQDFFAQCLADKGVPMYGAYWCPHCQNEKKAFGSSFQFVPYVECTEDTKKCLAAGIQGYPTWIFPDGSKLQGEQGLLKLS